MLKKITLLRERVEDWILSFDEGHLHPIAYEETAPMQIVRRFVNDRGSFLQELFQETPSLFEEPDR